MKEQELHSSIETNPAMEPPRLYLPFLAAVEQNRIDLDAVVLHRPGDVPLLIRNGFMPRQGAVIDQPDRAAYDLVEASIGDSEIRLLPTSKDAVDDETKRIQGPGLIVLTWVNGRVKLVSSLDVGPKRILHGNPERYGNLAIKSLVMNPSCEYEAKDIDSQGAVIISPRRRYL